MTSRDGSASSATETDSSTEAATAGSTGAEDHGSAGVDGSSGTTSDGGSETVSVSSVTSASSGSTQGWTSSSGTEGATLDGPTGESTGDDTSTTGTLPACAENLVATCTGTHPIECHFGGAPGDYVVTLDLGGAGAGDMFVEAESHRRMLGQTLTQPGETARFSFFVNVREPEGQPIQDVPAGTSGLDIYIRGASPQLSSICFEARSPAPKLWLAGDSTVCDQGGTDYAGWGQHLPQFFTHSVSIANYADSGESSGSFLRSSRLWGAITAGWRPGDWVVIQLGHNDKEVTAATFRSNLTTLVTQAKAAGVSPIFVTPIARVGFELEDEHINSTGADLPQIVRELGEREDVPVIDLTVTTWNWLQGIDWTHYFALGTDRTHPNPEGAEVIAGFVRDAIRDQELALADDLRP